MPALRSWLISLYPSDWRERYAAEFDAMLEHCLHSPLDVVDVILGAVDAHFQLYTGEQVNWRIINMVNKLRTTILIVFASLIGFIVAGMALLGMLDDSPMIPFMQSNLPSTVAMDVIRAGAVIALLAVLIGGLPLAVTVIRRAFTTSHHNLWLLTVPVVSFLVFVLYTGFVFLLGTGRIHISGVVRVVQPGNFPTGNRLLLAGWMLVFVLGAIASTLAVWKAVSRTEGDHQLFRVRDQAMSIDIYRFAFLPAVIATIAMLVMLVATLAWSWLVFSALPQVLAGDFGPWQTSTQAWLYGIIALMVISSLAALSGIVRGRSDMEPA